MTSTPLDVDTDIFTDLMSTVMPDYDEGTLYILDYRSEHEMLSNKTQAFFKISDGVLYVLHEVLITITKTGATNKLVAETSKGDRYYSAGGCSCPKNHPIPVEKGETITVDAGEFHVLPL